LIITLPEIPMPLAYEPKPAKPDKVHLFGQTEIPKEF
jgi:hypothetical protein